MFSRLRSSERISVSALALIGFVARIALAFRSTWQISSRPYLDDAFYLFSCAKQLALGHGFSVDGTHPTNGVQPLICLLYVPGFLLGDLWLGLRLTFVIGALVQAASIVAIALLVVKLQKRTPGEQIRWYLSPAIIASLIWMISAPLNDQNGNGLETGLVSLLLMMALTFYATIRVRGWTVARSLFFGVLLGVLVLARVDSVLLVIALLVVEWRDLRFTFISAAAAFVLSLPWWLYGFVTFGSIMPISGRAESLHHSLSQNLLQSAAALFDMLTIFFNHGYYAWSALLEITAFVAILFICALFWKRASIGKYLSEHVALKPLKLLALFGLLLFLFYNFFFGAPHFIVRYLHPVRIGIILVFAMALPRLIEYIREQSRLLMCLAIAFSIAAVCFSVFRYQNLFTAPPKSDFYRVGLWAREQRGRVGMMQSGTAGFITSNVVNLDGKVYVDALHAAQTTGIGSYITKERFEYLADWKPFVTMLDSAAERSGAHYALFDSIGYVLIYRLVPPRP